MGGGETGWGDGILGDGDSVGGRTYYYMGKHNIFYMAFWFQKVCTSVNIMCVVCGKRMYVCDHVYCLCFEKRAYVCEHVCVVCVFRKRTYVCEHVCIVYVFRKRVYVCEHAVLCELLAVTTASPGERVSALLGLAQLLWIVELKSDRFVSRPRNSCFQTVFLRLSPPPHFLFLCPRSDRRSGGI
jgi:hypothetical protein